MFTFLSRIIIKGGPGADTRSAYGMLSGVFGIVLNILLFTGKYIAGAAAGSIAIMADAFNNLSDAGSSLVTYLGFRMSGKKPDAEHPYGHGRMEYISAFVVAMLIVLMGAELLKSSVSKILRPSETEVTLLSVCVLVVSVFVKLYMFAYNRRFGALLDSEAMKATAKDSLWDAVSTAVVLAASVVMRFTGLRIDGWCGAAVALFILYAGYATARDTVDILCGRAPDKKLVSEIEQLVKQSPNVSGIHDLVVNDYGPGRMMISLHAEVPAAGDIMELHDEIDNLERRLKSELGCEAVIHMDPIDTSDEETAAMRSEVETIVKEISEKTSIHDFRMVSGPTHRNLIFDAVMPFELDMKDSEFKAEITRRVREKHGDCYCVITVDRPYSQ